MTAEEVIAPGSPYYSVFAEAAKLGLDSSVLAELPPEMAVRVESMIGEEMGWGDAGLAVSLAAATFPLEMARRGRQPGTRRPVHGQDRLLDDHAPRQGQRRHRLRHQHATGPPGQPGNKGNMLARLRRRRNRHQRAVFGMGVERRGGAGGARLPERRLRRRLLRLRRPSARRGGDHSARPSRRVEGQAARQVRPALRCRRARSISTTSRYRSGLPLR